jgi:hypothetical protein
MWLSPGNGGIHGSAVWGKIPGAGSPGIPQEGESDQNPMSLSPGLTSPLS